MKKFLHLAIFAVAGLAAALAAVNVGVAWGVVSAMTAPPCLEPQPLAGFPAPEEYWLPTTDDIEIRVWYYPSQNGAAVLETGGMNGALGERLPPVDFLLQAGYGVIQVDTRACARPPAPVTQGYNETHDAEAALDFLLARPEVTPDRIGIIGFSMGGATAISVAARRSEIQSVVRDGGFSNLGELLAPAESDSLPIRIHRRTLLGLYRLRTGVDPWAISPIDDLDAVSPRPVLLIYGEYEADAGLEQAQADSQNIRLWIVPGGAHGRNHLAAPQEYERRVLDFFAKTLKPQQRGR